MVSPGVKRMKGPFARVSPQHLKGVFDDLLGTHGAVVGREHWESLCGTLCLAQGEVQ